MGAPNDEGKVIPIGGKGLGTFEQYGAGNIIIDTGAEGYPEGTRLDVLIIPVGQVQPVSGIQIPRGAGVVIHAPELMAHLRAQIRAAQTKAGPPHNPAQKG